MFEELTLEPGGFGYHDHGAYGIVFANVDRTRIVKVYRTCQDWEHAEKVFKSEVEAIAVASADRDLRPLTASDLIARSGCSLIDRDGRDRTDLIFGDLAFEVSFLEGEFVKLNDCPGSEADHLRGLLREAGIDGSDDVSVVFDATGQVRYVVDFAMTKSEQQWRDGAL